MNKPLVSVLIPAYNHEKYVQETISSIINQTYENIELIIVDDGSPDSTWQKIQEMKDKCEQRFKRVHFETKENEGTCSTLNKLISLAQGEYVFFTASDDVALPLLIEKEVEFLSKNEDYALVVADNAIIDSDSKRCYWLEKQQVTYNKTQAKYETFARYLEDIRKFKFTDNEFGSYKNLYKGNHIPNGFLVKKSIYKKTGLYKLEAPLEDWYMNLQISKYAKMKFIDEVLFYYRWHGNNTIISDPQKMANYNKLTIEYDNTILDRIKITEKNILPDVIDVKYNRDITNLQNKIFDTNKIILEFEEKVNNYINSFNNKINENQKEIEQLKYNLKLLQQKDTIYKKYYRYKVLSKILFGKKREHYNQKAKKYHKMVRKLRNLSK